ncbi:hypothetical protein Tco_0205439 [Tanacetum coccineum]
MCKQCLITANHDVCVLKYVNDMNSCGDKHSANVSKTANRRKHKSKGKKPKKVGSKERLASPKPRKPRTCLRWLPTGRIFDLKGKRISFDESKCQFDSSRGDNECNSNPQEPTIKRFPNFTLLLDRLSKFVYGIVGFGNDHVAAILGYGDLQWGNILITRVYFIEGLGHNLFSVGKGKKVSPPPKPVPNSKQRSKDEAPEEIKTFLKKITVSLQAPVIIQLLLDLCYPKNYREDIRKLGVKGDIGFLIGYSATSCTYRVYN